MDAVVAAAMNAGEPRCFYLTCNLNSLKDGNLWDYIGHRV